MGVAVEPFQTFWIPQESHTSHQPLCRCLSVRACTHAHAHAHAHAQRFQEATVNLDDVNVGIYIACLPFQFFRMPDLIW